MTSVMCGGASRCVIASCDGAEYELAVAGEYKEKAMDFLQNHWQAAALKSLADVGVLLLYCLVAPWALVCCDTRCNCLVLVHEVLFTSMRVSAHTVG